MMTPYEIGKIVKYYRNQAGLSRQEFAKIAGVGKTALFDIEKGKETVQLNTLLKILDVLNIQMTFKTPFPQKEENQE